MGMGPDPRLLAEFTRETAAAVAASAGTFFRYPYRLTEVPEPFRFFVGEYGAKKHPIQPFYRVWDAAAPRKTKKGGRGSFLTCNCQGGKTDAQCTPCFYRKHPSMDTRPRKPRKDGQDASGFSPVGKAQIAFAVNCVHLAHYHQVQDIGSSGKEYTKWIQCPGEKCDMCKNKVPTRFGRTTYMVFSGTDWEDFNSFNRTITRKCRTKGCEGQVIPVKAKCPKCGQYYQNLQLDSLFRMEDMKATCPACATMDYATMEYDCMVRDPRERKWARGCGTPTVGSIWEADMELRVVSVQKEGKTVKSLEMTNHMVFPADDSLKALMKPMNFNFLLSTPPHIQAEIMELPNPFTVGGDTGPRTPVGGDSTTDDAPAGGGGDDASAAEDLGIAE